MAVIRSGGGRMSIAPSKIKKGDKVIRTISGGSGGSSNRQSTIATPTPSASELTGSAAQRQLQISAFQRGGQNAFNQEKARQEIERKQRETRIRLANQQEIQRNKILMEQVRIAKLRAKLQREGAQRQVQNFINQNGDKVRHENIIIRRSGERVFTVTNLVTGKVTTRTFERPKGGGNLVRTGEFSTTPGKNTQSMINNITKNLPNRDTLIYDKKTFKILGIKSNILNMTIPWNKKGIEFYNREIAKRGLDAFAPGMSKVPKSKFEKIASGEEKFKITKKLENFYARIGILDKKKLAAWEKNALVKVDKWEQRPNGDELKKVWGTATEFSNSLFIDLPVALYNLGERTTKTVYNEIPKSKQDVKNNLKRANEFVQNQLKRVDIKKLSSKKFYENLARRYVEIIVKGSSIPFKLQKQIFKLTLKIIRLEKSPKKFIKKLSSLKLKDIQKFAKKTEKDIAIASGVFVARLSGLATLPMALTDLANNPANIKKIPGQFIADTGATLTLLRTAPLSGIAKIGADLLSFKIVGAGLKFTGKYKTQIATRLNPKFKSFKNNVIKIKVPQEAFIRRGGKVYLKKRVPLKPGIIDRIKGRKPGQFKKFQKTPGVELKTGVIGKGTSLAEQAKLAGTKGTITTAQADKLIGFFKRNRLIRKPIPNEASFTALTRRLLKKFDEGKISKKEFSQLNKRVLKESGKTMLERSLFADPNGVVRFTRLGEGVAEASIGDILRGNFSFKKSKPQIIVFPEGQIAKFPASLKAVVKKLKAGKKLTPKERSLLVKWQVKGGDKWKPVGDVAYKNGIELEVTLAPGSTVRYVKKLAVTEINGVRVPIIQARVVKLTKQTTTLLNKAKTGKILPKDIARLRKLIKKETKYNLSVKDINNLRKNIRVRAGGRPFLPVRRIGVSRVLSRVRKAPRKSVKRTPSKRKPTPRKTTTGRKSVKRTPNKRKPTPRKTTTGRKSVKRTPNKRKPSPRKTTTGRPPRTPKRPPKKPPIKPRVTKGFTKKKQSKAQPVYLVREKIRGKIKTLSPKPLTIKDAMDFAAFRIDNRLSRTSFFEPMGKSKTIVVPGRMVKGYFSKNRKKFRRFKIRFGKKKQLLNGIIEKRKYIQDTVSEKRQLKRSIKRKKTTIQRKTPSQKTSKRFNRRRSSNVRARTTTIKASKRKTTIQKTKKKTSPGRLKLMLKNLAKARSKRKSHKS